MIMSVKKLVCVLTVVAAIGGMGLSRYATAQTAPGQATCQGACGYALGSCAAAAAQGVADCVKNCRNMSCANACVTGLQANIAGCRDAFDGCTAGCS